LLFVLFVHRLVDDDMDLIAEEVVDNALQRLI
jgi:hypothetical protein